MRTYSRIAVHQAARVAHNPFRRNISRGNLHTQIPLREKVIQFIKKIINNVASYVREEPTGNRTIRRSTKSSTGARNKDDPHLAGRV